MRSSWSAERIVALVAAASLEGAWLTLAYLAVQWAAGADTAYLGIAHFAAAAGGGLLLARVVRTWSGPTYGWFLVGVAIVAGIAGTWLALVPGPAAADLQAAAAANPGGWLVGVAVLRGSTHADLDEEAGMVERFLDFGLIGLAVFWVFAAGSGLEANPGYGGVAFAATITFVSGALLSLGLARLTELGVDGVDRAASGRWIVMLLAVSAILLVLGIPLAAVLGMPVSAVLAGVAGPFGPLLVYLIVAIGVALGLVVELLSRLVPPLSGVAFPSVGPIGSPQFHPLPPGQSGGAAPDLGWLLWLVTVVAFGLVFLAVASLLHRPAPGSERGVDAEIREAEPMGTILPRLPRFRFGRRRARPRTPRTASEAYQLTLALLAGSDEERGPAETPRGHAHRIAQTQVGPGVGRLAVDYQLTTFAGRPLSPAEERRALNRWRQIERTSRSAPRAPQGGDRSG